MKIWYDLFNITYISIRGRRAKTSIIKSTNISNRKEQSNLEKRTNLKEVCLTKEQAEEIRRIAGDYQKNPHQLMEILFSIQDICSNTIPREAAVIFSEETGIPVAKIYSYISFYSMFSAEQRGKYVVRMCKSAPCHVCGAVAVMEAISKTLGINPGETTSDGKFTLEYCQCLGLCESAPAIMVNDKVYKDLTPGRAMSLMEDYQRGEVR